MITQNEYELFYANKFHGIFGVPLNKFIDPTLLMCYRASGRDTMPFGIVEFEKWLSENSPYDMRKNGSIQTAVRKYFGLEALKLITLLVSVDNIKEKKGIKNVKKK